MPAARPALALALLLGCTAKQVRPAPDARLLTAFGDADGQGIAIYLRDVPDEQHSRMTLVRQSIAGPMLWRRPLEGRYEVDMFRAQTFGSSLVVPAISGQSLPSGGLLHLHLGDGAMHEWAPPIVHAEVVTVLGDQTSAHPLWIGEAIGDGPVPFAVAAHDVTSEARTWSVVDSFASADLHARLAPDVVLAGAAGSDWQGFRRDTGARVPLPALDVPGLCFAGGRWWAGRDDRLVDLTLADPEASTRSLPATFIPPDEVHQWSLIDCAAHGDEVVLAINRTARGLGLLVGVDPDSRAVRWTLDLPRPLPTIRTPNPADTWPARLGDFAFVRQLGPRSVDPCAVDLADHRLLWCVGWDGAAAHADGSDWLLRGRVGEALHVARLSGSVGEPTAAVAITDELGSPFPHLRDGKLWVHLDLPELAPDQIPLLVLDARTLRPAVPGAVGRASADARARDILPDVDRLLVHDPVPVAAPVAFTRPPVNPWERDIDGSGPAWNPTELADQRRATVLAALSEAGLPASTPTRVLGHRGALVVAAAEHDGRWTLLKGHGVRSEHVAARTFNRRLTAADVYRFLLDVEPRADRHGGRGTTDEAAWNDVVGEPRTALWLLE